MAHLQAGDPAQLIATQEAGMIVAVQPDPAAPFVPMADYNIIADPAEFAGALLEVLGR
jgi:electron transfer flavoprotein alpha subunit